MRGNPTTLWRVIYIARNAQHAGKIENLLREAGFLVDWKRPEATGAQREDIEIRALDSEAEEARHYLLEQGY